MAKIARGDVDDPCGDGKLPDVRTLWADGANEKSASSVAANIAEGCGRSSDADFARFLHHAMGSASEVEYFVLLAFDLGHLKAAPYERLTAAIQEVKRMIASLIAKLKAES